MNKNELRNTILSQIQLPCIGKNRMQVEPVSGQMQTRQLQQAIDDLSWAGRRNAGPAAGRLPAPVRCT